MYRHCQARGDWATQSDLVSSQSSVSDRFAWRELRRGPQSLSGSFWHTSSTSQASLLLCPWTHPRPHWATGETGRTESTTSVLCGVRSESFITFPALSLTYLLFCISEEAVEDAEGPSEAPADPEELAKDQGSSSEEVQNKRAGSMHGRPWPQAFSLGETKLCQETHPPLSSSSKVCALSTPEREFC